jgi:hypothetical protein
VRRTYETDFDAFTEDYDLSVNSRRYDELLDFVPKSANSALDAERGSGVLALQGQTTWVTW